MKNNPSGRRAGYNITNSIYAKNLLSDRELGSYFSSRGGYDYNETDYSSGGYNDYYENIDDCQISITYIDNLFPILFKMIENNETGVCNFTNPGQINLTEIINKYEKFTNTKTNIKINFNSIDNKRSLSKLNTHKINKYKPLNSDEAIEECIKKYRTLAYKD